MQKDDERMAQPQTAGSTRLIFEYDGDNLRLVSSHDVELAPPASDAKTAGADEAGFWLEVRDARLQVMHRQIMHDPMMTHAEVFSNEPGKSIARSTTPVRKGAFTVLVPRLPTSDHLAFVRMDAPARERARTARVGAAPIGEIARFSLGKGASGDTKGETP